MDAFTWTMLGVAAVCFLVAVLLWRAEQQRIYKPLDKSLWTDWEREKRKAELRRIQAPGLGSDRKRVG